MRALLRGRPSAASLARAASVGKALASARRAGYAPPIPPGYHSVTPYLIVRDAARALGFYKEALGATELFRMPGPEGRVAHAEFKIGDSILMISDEWPEMGYLGPKSRGGTTVGLMVYVPDADAAFARAVSCGATVLKPMQDQFYGDRSGTVADPFGHSWTLSTHVEDVPPEEMERRMAASMQKQG
ncbi:MAG: VOC family protein [Gemmataceae bacterium]|nr:VOC family protein [Gemmataceae bacterium]